MAHELPSLPYAYDALAAVIDEETMKLHHDKHHQAYITKLNEALEKHPELADKSVDSLLLDLTSIPEDIRGAVRNHGGGHVNHTLFWEMMTPGGATEPQGELKEQLEAAFGSVDAFKTAFEDAGTKQFGSGWVWLVKDRGVPRIVTTPNQDSPISQGFHPIFGNDVWEHAYYLKYQNRRPEYLKAWWGVLNWTKVEERYAQF